MEGIQFLIENTADINTVSQNGYTCLHVAVSNGHLNTVELLIENRANINAVDNNNNTVLHVAIEKKYLPIIAYLLSKNADVSIRNNRNKTAIETTDNKDVEKLFNTHREETIQHLEETIRQQDKQIALLTAVTEASSQPVSYNQYTQLNENFNKVTALFTRFKEQATKTQFYITETKTENLRKTLQKLQNEYAVFLSAFKNNSFSDDVLNQTQSWPRVMQYQQRLNAIEQKIYTFQHQLDLQQQSVALTQKYEEELDRRHAQYLQELIKQQNESVQYNLPTNPSVIQSLQETVPEKLLNTELTAGQTNVMVTMQQHQAALKQLLSQNKFINNESKLLINTLPITDQIVILTLFGKCSNFR